MKKRTTNGRPQTVDKMYQQMGRFPLVVLGKIMLNRDKVG